MKLITQESPMGCAIACTASLANLSYKQMRKLFNGGRIKESTQGFYNRDIIYALSKIKVSAKTYSAKTLGNKKIGLGSIVFIERSKKYPAGHYLLKTKNGWMNPWINYPNINPAKSGFQKTLPGRVVWIIKIF
jgi:ABC-type bacteriocin/lantibiotic exporter with double-glycine peptidase domain